MNEFHFDFRDVFRAGRYGFSSKKITVHLIGLALAYLIYEVIVYISLFIAGGSAVGDFWKEYALVPVCPIVDYELEPITVGAMWLGLLVFFVIFFSTSAMVSKITIQQLRRRQFLFNEGSGIVLEKPLESHLWSVRMPNCGYRSLYVGADRRRSAWQDSVGRESYRNVVSVGNAFCIFAWIADSLSACDSECQLVLCSRSRCRYRRGHL